MPRPKGTPKTGGRKKGTPNRLTVAKQSAVKRAAKSLPGNFKGDAHALLVAVYKNDELPLDIRMDAAKAAIRYEKPSLASVTAESGELGIAERIRKGWERIEEDRKRKH